MILLLRKKLAYLFHFLLRPRGFNYVGADLRIQMPRRIKGHMHMRLGDNIRVAKGSWIQCFTCYAGEHFIPKIEIGSYVQIGYFATITAVDHIKIGHGCLFSDYVYISDHMHNVFDKDVLPLVDRKLIPKGAITIGDYCFLGFRAIILPGVVLGDRCVVGAGSVVTKSFPARSVIAGVPAKLIRTLPDE